MGRLNEANRLEMREPDKLTYAAEPGLLYGRPGPSKSRWSLPAIRAAGIRVIVSLVPNPTSREVEAEGMIHYPLLFEDHIRQPYRSANAPIKAILQAFDHILDRHLPRREPILVHCNSGRDRTGLLLTYYLVTRRGLNVKRAIRDIRRLKADALQASGFEQFVITHEKWMRRRRR